MKCPNCGTENNPEARFCKSCAAPQTPEATPPPVAPTAPLPPPPPPPPAWRPHQPYQPFVGLLGLVFFLVAVAVMLSQNPSFFDGIRQWTQIVTPANTVFVRPPDPIIVSAAWFFGAIGAFEFVLAFVRWSLRWLPLRSASRILSGVGDLIFAVLLLRYADRAISGGFLITVLVGVFAALLTVYVTLGVYWSAGRHYPWFAAPQPRMRP